MGCTLDGAALDNKADERGSGRGWYEEEGCPRETEREGKRMVERRREESLCPEGMETENAGPLNTDLWALSSLSLQ